MRLICVTYSICISLFVHVNFNVFVSAIAALPAVFDCNTGLPVELKVPDGSAEVGTSQNQQCLAQAVHIHI